MPKVSVLLPTYNDARYVLRAVESILRQTFHDFELIIVDDGSTDETHTVLASLRDPRIRVVTNERNLGLAPSLNRAISAARGKYLARQDADDLALPHRLETQVRYLDAHPDIGMVGSAGIVIDDQGNERGVWKYPCDDFDIKWVLLFQPPFMHSSVMMRHAILEQTGGYNEDPTIHRAFVEDYDLWSRINRFARSANLEEPLQKYRLNPTSASTRTQFENRRQGEQVSYRNICQLLGCEALEHETWQGLRRFLFHPLNEELDLDSAEVRRTIAFLRTIHEAFCRKYAGSWKLAGGHRIRTYWKWGKHALALSYRRNGRRDLNCRVTLLTAGSGLLLRILLPGIVPPQKFRSTLQNDRT